MEGVALCVNDYLYNSKQKSETDTDDIKDKFDKIAQNLTLESSLHFFNPNKNVPKNQLVLKGLVRLKNY
tara:strand:+ start:11483 stop:11689 length:207 start_codon:yes stop_codon:yes gene_type:complete